MDPDLSLMYILFSVKDGVFRQFKGSRKVKDFLDFIEEKKEGEGNY